MEDIMGDTDNLPKFAFGKINESGRLMIPAAIRKELGIKAGERLFMEVEDGVLRVQTHRSVIRRIQEEFRKHHPIKSGEMLISDQLIAERREEARREQEETDRELEEFRLRNEKQLV
jgi:AbrB family looped-hinge helix DNA binding protein